MSPKVNSSPNSAKVGSMFSMVEIYSPLSILSVSSSPLRLSPEGQNKQGPRAPPWAFGNAYHTPNWPWNVSFHLNNPKTTEKPQERSTSTPINSLASIYVWGDAILFHAHYVIHKQTPWPIAGSDWLRPVRSCHETSHHRPMTGPYSPWSDSTSTIRSLGVIWINRSPYLHEKNSTSVDKRCSLEKMTAINTHSHSAVIRKTHVLTVSVVSSILPQLMW